ncbi:glycosyltransferase [Microbacterium sp. 2FI]|uniref:glycosyltransferase n=1 Tax=Microbacterium sp. 2FI TaxID=2502193 RepID=UPI0010F600E7|nr:glycosyltransferase [Microbacterium sp. 2FI]
MSQPLVSIIIPISKEEGRIGDTLRSCTSQSLSQIEIICVDSSAAGDNKGLDGIADSDPRIRLIRQASDTSAPAALRIGVLAAEASHILLLHPDEVLHPDAAAAAQRKATDADADLVEVGATIGASFDARDAASGARVRRLRPRLQDEDILRQLFPEDSPLDADSRRYLFRAALLRTVYGSLTDASASDVADLMALVFLACAAAKTYVSLPQPLYRRARISAFSPATDAVASITAIEPVVSEWSRRSPNPEPLVDGYESVRLATIARALETLSRLPGGLAGAEATQLRRQVGEVDVIAAAATFGPSMLKAMAQHGDRIELGKTPARSVLLTTSVLRTGGVSGVLRSQAQLLLDAGYRVTIATHRPGSDESAVPDGATLVQISGSTRHRLAQWAELCRKNEVDVVIDHRILYSRDWPALALAARTSQAATIGWIHNFAGRPTYNGNDLHSLMQGHLNALAQLIVLSPLDVAFWKLRGVNHTAYLPNPPSPLLLGSVGRIAPKSAPKDRRLELIWWGRLEEHTKKVTELVEVAAALRRLRVDFRLRIVGPDWTDMSAAQLSTLVSERGLDGFVDVTGPRHGDDLLDAIDSSDIFVNTSIIEGYPLTMPEAQSRGLPILMYDLSWLSLVKDNPGIIAVPQGDAAALAAAIADLAGDSVKYETVSRASVEAAERATSYDFAKLYEQLVSGSLPPDHSPDPTLEDGRKILDLLIFFAEKRRLSPTTPARRRRKSSDARDLTFGAQIERRLTRSGHQVLGVVPWLRPAARRIKRALLRF